MIIAFDLDHTIVENGTEENDFLDATPIENMVELVNMIYDEGFEIMIFTARSKPWSQVQLEEWLRNDIGLKFHYVYMHKPHYSILVDDRAVGWKEGFTKENLHTLLERIKQEEAFNKERGYD